MEDGHKTGLTDHVSVLSLVMKFSHMSYMAKAYATAGRFQPHEGLDHMPFTSYGQCQPHAG